MGPNPRYQLPGPKIRRPAGSTVRDRGERLLMVDGGAGPGMVAAIRGRRTYHPGPLTLGVSLRPRRDNRGNFTPMGVGTTEANKRPRKRRGRPPKSTYILHMGGF